MRETNNSISWPDFQRFFLFALYRYIDILIHMFDPCGWQTIGLLKISIEC